MIDEGDDKGDERERVLASTTCSTREGIRCALRQVGPGMSRPDGPLSAEEVLLAHQAAEHVVLFAEPND